MVGILIFDFGLGIRVVATKSGSGHQKIIFSRIRLNPDSQLRQFIIEWGDGEKNTKKNKESCQFVQQSWHCRTSRSSN